MLAQINFTDLYAILQGKGFRFGIQDPRTVGGILSVLLPYLFVAAGILLLLYLIYGGFSFMLARGEPKAVQEAKTRITNALIGFFIVFLAYLIVQVLGTILGVEKILEIF